MGDGHLRTQADYFVVNVCLLPKENMLILLKGNILLVNDYFDADQIEFMRVERPTVACCTSLH